MFFTSNGHLMDKEHCPYKDLVKNSTFQFLSTSINRGKHSFYLRSILGELRHAVLWLASCGFWFQNSQRNVSVISCPLEVKKSIPWEISRGILQFRWLHVTYEALV